MWPFDGYLVIFVYKFVSDV